MTNKFIPEYPHDDELQFTENLTEWLNNKTITINTSRDEQPTRTIQAQHQPEKFKDKDYPDIEINHHEPATMEWHTLTSPFYIEGKLHWKDILDNLHQFLRYKYKRKNSHKRYELEKYGDFNIVAVTPTMLTEQFDQRDFEEPGLSDAYLIRVLWKLGIGVMYLNERKDTFTIAFNEQEVVDIEY